MTRFIDQHRDRFGVEPICRTLGVSASAYYHRATGARSARAVQDERLLGVIRQTHKDNFEAYGYRKMWKTLRRQGETAPRCQVQRLMRQDGLRGAKRRGRSWRTTIGDPGAAARPDLVNRDFTADAPDRLWVGDFTYLRCWEGRAFFSFIIDVFSRKISSAITCAAASEERNSGACGRNSSEPSTATTHSARQWCERDPPYGVKFTR